MLRTRSLLLLLSLGFLPAMPTPPTTVPGYRLALSPFVLHPRRMIALMDLGSGLSGSHPDSILEVSCCRNGAAVSGYNAAHVYRRPPVFAD